METIISELAREVKENIGKGVKEGTSGQGLEFGTITATGLKVDSFKHEIKDYMLLDYLNLKEDYTTEVAGTYPHNHISKTPNPLKSLKTGDRILVASIGNEFVVIGRVLNG